MEVHQRGLITGILMAALAISPLAEAKRAGGGKSHGMARSTTSSQSYQQPRQVTPVQQTTTAPQKSGPGCWFNGCSWCGWCCRRCCCSKCFS